MPGKRQTDRGRRCEELIREIGPDATFEQVDACLRREGLGPVHEVTFKDYCRRIFREGAVGQTHEANGQAKPAPPPVPDDYLARVARFALMVEAVGGIDAAQRMLDLLKQFRGANA